MLRNRPDLSPYADRELTVIAWLWARTVKSPDPAFAEVPVPLITTFMLSTRRGKEAYIEPVIEPCGYHFCVNVGAPRDAAAAKVGTKLSRGANFRCLMSGVPIAPDYIRAEAKAGRMGSRLIGIVAEGAGGRVYLSPTSRHEAIAHDVHAEWSPDVEFFQQALGFRVGGYGMTHWSDLFTSRQLAMLSTFAGIVNEARERVKRSAVAASVPDDGRPLRLGGFGATAYAEAVSVYLGFALSKQADLGNSLCRWEPIAQCPRQLFGRQAIPMVWDYAEGNPLGNSSGSWTVFVDGIVKAFTKSFESVDGTASGRARQADAGTQSISLAKVVSTDPPYYDNIGYADLSDFFYVWLRRSLQSTFPDLFATIAVPKEDELVATPGRHGGSEQAERFFLGGMTQAMSRLAEQTHPAFPVSIYYAFKQSESANGAGKTNTGWATFLDAVIEAGFSLTGTWPMRTENNSRMRGMNSNALASSIVLVCRKRAVNAPIATRRDVIAALRAELPLAIAQLKRGNIAPVDLAQAAIGPGMAVYTRYARVLDATGHRVSVSEALGLINQVLDEFLKEQEGDVDAESRWAFAWFEQNGFDAGDYGIAETLSKAKNTSVGRMVRIGILRSQAGKVRLLRPRELALDWDPSADHRLTAWKIVHHLIRVLEQGGESATAELVRRLSGWGEVARDLCYRLYTLSDRKKRAAEALAYDMLVRSWPEITRLARMRAQPEQAELFGDGEHGAETVP